MENSTAIATDDLSTGIPSWALVIISYIIPYTLALLIPAGILGNLFSIYIFIKNRKKESVSAQYLGLLACSDCMTIACIGLPIWLYVNLKTVSFGRLVYAKQYPTDLGCKFGAYIWNVGSFLSGWIVTFFSVERCLVIWFPLKMTAMVSSNKPRKIILAALVTFGLSCYSIWIPWVRLISVNEGEEPSKCSFVVPEDASPFASRTRVFFSHDLSFVIPLCLIPFFNILILIGVKKNRMSAESKSSKKDAKQDSRMLVNLILVSSFYVIFNALFTITWYVFRIFQPSNFEGWTAQQRRDFTKIWLASDSLHYFNYCINPFVYTFSLDFYQAQMKRIFCRCLSKPAEQTSASSAITSTGSTKN